MNLTIPEAATGAVVLIRHSVASKKGMDANRALSPQGRELCRRAAGYWQMIRQQLAVRFGDPDYFHSPLPRALVTLWELFGAEVMISDNRLGLHVTTTIAGGGQWFAEQVAKNRNVLDIVREFVVTPELHDGQDVAGGTQKYEGFMLDQADHLAVAVCHEPLISLTAHWFGSPDDQLGLNECEGVVFFTGTRDGQAVVISAQKIIPVLSA
jgi:hypothetical protein